jgi:hypothetical protein
MNSAFAYVRGAGEFHIMEFSWTLTFGLLFLGDIRTFIFSYTLYTLLYGLLGCTRWRVGLFCTSAVLLHVDLAFYSHRVIIIPLILLQSIWDLVALDTVKIGIYMTHDTISSTARPSNYSSSVHDHRNSHSSRRGYVTTTAGSTGIGRPRISFDWRGWARV